MGFLLAQPAVAACELWHAVYRDAAGHGFTLEFSSSSTGLAQPFAVASIRHKTRGALYRFEVSKGNGYGAVTLSDPAGAGQWHGLYFFDARMRPSDTGATPWLFIDRLGVMDYYARNDQAPALREPLLEDNLWRFTRCKKVPAVDGAD